MTAETYQNALMDVQDRFRSLDRRERTTYRCPDYLSLKDIVGTVDLHTLRMDLRTMREDMIGIIFKFADLMDEQPEITFDREVVSAAANIADRYLSIYLPRILHDKGASLHQPINLIFVTSLYIASKAHHGRMRYTPYLPPFHVACPVHSHQDYIETEAKILKALDWNILSPTPASVVEDLALLLPPSMQETQTEEVLCNARYVTELAVSDYDLSIAKPSSIALAAMTIALEEQKKNAVCSVDLGSHFKVVVGMYLGEMGFDCGSHEVQWCRERLYAQYRRGMGQCMDLDTTTADEVEVPSRVVTPFIVDPLSSLRV